MIDGVGESRHQVAVPVIIGVAPTVVPVQVGVDHQVDLLRRHAHRRQAANQAPVSLEAHEAALLLGELVAVAGIDQERMPAGLDEQAVQLNADAVLLVRLGELLPLSLGHQAEKPGAIEPVFAIRDQVETGVAQSHGQTPPQEGQGFMRSFYHQRVDRASALFVRTDAQSRSPTH